MGERAITPHGTWRSPITADRIVQGVIVLGQIQVDGADVYWTEARPSEGGRSVVVRRTPDGKCDDLTPPPFSARSRVHEYGGGAFTVAAGAVYFSNFSDQRIYRQAASMAPEPITPEGALRYADAVFDRWRDRLICVREDHGRRGHEPVNALVEIDMGGRTEPVVLVSGRDFYSSPRLSTDGRSLAWLSWDHPNMPWDGCELSAARIDASGRLGRTRRIAGGMRESLLQPEWSTDGSLYFVSDRGGWWNLCRWRGGEVEIVLEMEAEFGRPPWSFGESQYVLESADSLVCSYSQNGRWRLARLRPEGGELQPLVVPYTDIQSLRRTERGVVFRGGSATELPALVHLDLHGGEIQTWRRSSEVAVEAGYLSEPETIEFSTSGGETARGLYYAPRNADVCSLEGERPPLLVKSHGGPTGAASPTLDLRIQYWTSRGIAVLDVNYRGSTGFGRSYREQLEGEWGVADVDDCVAGARHLVERGDVDEQRLAISGSSAGGYTTLCALTFRDVFRAGASAYGISDLEALANDTHKFEARYLDRLVGPYPERRDLYRQRSPIHHVERLSCPMIFFQGLDDRVVPPQQTERMVAALRGKGIPVACLLFEGEAHGFRRADSIKGALEAELYFYGRVFGFTPADPISPVSIENL